MRRDPASWVLIGTVVLFAFLFPPSLLILGVVLLVIGMARSSRRKAEQDSEYAARFHELESGIVGDSDLEKKARRRRARRMSG